MLKLTLPHYKQFGAWLRYSHPRWSMGTNLRSRAPL